jgi:hypothetical protein
LQGFVFWQKQFGVEYGGIEQRMFRIIHTDDSIFNYAYWD